MAEELFYGRIVDMVRVSDGSTFAVAGSIADTVLHLVDVTDFDAENGGQVQIAGNVYDYTDVDDVANTVTITTGLLAAADVDDLVEIVNPELGEVVVEYVAHVLLDEQDPEDEPIEVTVQQGLVNHVKEDIRGGVAEAVTLLRDGPDDFLILQLDGKLAVDLALKETQGQVDQVQIDLDQLNNVTLPQVQSDLASARTDITGLQGKFPITSTSISDSAITTPKLAANSVTGDKIVGNTIVGGHIVGLTITGDKIAANTISADKIVANSITSDKIAANAIDGKTISSANLRIGDGTLYGGSLGFYSSTALATRFRSLGAGTSWESGDGAVYIALPWTGGSGNQIAIAAPLVQVSGPVTATGALHGNTLWSDIDNGGTSSGADIGADGRIKRSTSSRRYKTDIADAHFDADVVLALRPVTYRRNDEPDTRRAGFIAEEVAALGLEEFIGYDAEGEVDTLRYADMVALLVARAQHDHAEITDIKARLAVLEGAAA